MTVNAADLRNKRLNLASKLVAEASTFMATLEKLYSLAGEYVATGLTFEDSDFEDTALQHLDAATAGGLISSIDAVRTFVWTNFHHTNFFKALP